MQRKGLIEDSTYSDLNVDDVALITGRRSFEARWFLEEIPYSQLYIHPESNEYDFE